MLVKARGCVSRSSTFGGRVRWFASRLLSLDEVLLRSLGCLLVCSFCLLAACTTPKTETKPEEAAPQTQVAPEAAPVTFRELTAGVWLHTSQKEIAPWGLVPTNGLVIEDGSNAILVDTAWDDPQTAYILNWSKNTLGKPITSAVFTHAHEDKMGGVTVVRESGARTYAASDSNAFAKQRGMTPAQFMLEFGEDGVSEQLSPLVVFDPGPGHTIDNIVVGFPEKGVIFGGCLIRPGDSGSLGNVADADVDHWDRAVELVSERFPSAQLVIPSHGPPAGRELLEHTIGLVRAAREN